MSRPSQGLDANLSRRAETIFRKLISAWLPIGRTTPDCPLRHCLCYKCRPHALTLPSHAESLETSSLHAISTRCHCSGSIRFHMATLRTTGPSLATIFRFASQPPATRRCAHCLRAQRCPFSSFRPALQSSKRPLMTETARTSTLDPEMPPRNDGIPETSISGNQQQQQQTWPPSTPWKQRQDSGAAVAETEGEAQKSKPTVSSSTAAGTSSQAETSSTAKPATPRKSKLRARKAPIKLTPVAVSQLRRLFDQPESKLIRIGVKNRGCSGLAYHLEYVDKPGAFDEAVEQDGVKVLIDSKALFSIIGSEMDWQEDKLSARFVFRNPNISEYHDPHPIVL